MKHIRQAYELLTTQQIGDCLAKLANLPHPTDGLTPKQKAELERAGQSGFPLITRPAKENHPGIAQDMRAEELWYIGARLPAASAWQKRMIIV